MQKYIYESANWPTFAWDKPFVADKLLSVNRQGGHLFGRLHDIGYDRQLLAMTEAMTDSVVDSYSIEGISLDAAQVRSSVARKLGVELHQEATPSHYVDGVVEMMIDATTNFRPPLTEDRLFGWHSALFPASRGGHRLVTVGAYRTAGMDVVSGVIGKEKVHYHAPAPEQVPAMMSQFLDWFNGDTPHDYIRAALAHLHFVSIHPFDDGNGRMARAISDMALSQADGSPMRYFSMSSQINKEKLQYNRILELTQKGDGDVTEWIAWWLDCLGRAIASTEEMLSTVLRKALFWQQHIDIAFTERQRTTLNLWLDGYDGKLTVKNWAKQAEVSPDTAARDVKDLVEKGVLAPKDNRQRNIEYDIR